MFAKGGLAALCFLALASGAAAEGASSAAEGANPKFRWPLRGAIVAPFKAGMNDGIDIAAPVGAPVHAAADGICVAAREDLKAYGKLVVIRHDGGYVTVYADNSEIAVREGDAVRRGQIIAKSGESGAALSPRLHFELRKDGQAIDPVRFLAPL